MIITTMTVTVFLNQSQNIIYSLKGFCQNKIIENTLFFADCGNLTAPADGSLTYSSGTTFQSVASFDCDTGYTLDGDSTRTCLANASWSNSDPSCKINGRAL